jgi:hypothetical protein
MKHKATLPTPPEAWLVVHQFGALEKVIGAFRSPSDLELLEMVQEEANSRFSVPTRVVRDDPSLEVSHYGCIIRNPYWLTARDNWFQRYERVLADHLRDPRVAHVYTFAPGRLTDPLATHKSSRDGPFPFPRGAAWPECGFCHHPLGFLGVMDFRGFTDVQVPHGSLVLHVCTECGVCADRETWATTWIREGTAVEILGNTDSDVLAGTTWDVTEYPTPAIYPEELVQGGPFLKEHSIYFNFACFADKRGGHVFWAQHENRLHDEHSFVSDTGEPLTYIGQFVSSPDIEIGDCGIAYLLYSPRTGETVMYPQCF